MAMHHAAAAAMSSSFDGVPTVTAYGAASSIGVNSYRSEQRERIFSKEQTPLPFSSLDFVYLVACDVQRQCTANANRTSEGPSRTPFHSVKIPGVTVMDYYRRIAKYSQCSTEVFIFSLVFLRRYTKSTAALVTARNVHRLAIISVMVAAKLHDDIFFSNTYYAAIGGLPATELNDLELEFLVQIEFCTAVNVEEFAAVEKELVAGFGGGLLPANGVPSALEASPRT
jgi:hypothetical protein